MANSVSDTTDSVKVRLATFTCQANRNISPGTGPGDQLLARPNQVFFFQTEFTSTVLYEVRAVSTS